MANPYDNNPNQRPNTSTVKPQTNVTAAKNKQKGNKGGRPQQTGSNKTGTKGDDNCGSC